MRGPPLPGLLVVTGMARETRIPSGPAALVLGSGGTPALLRALLSDPQRQPSRAVMIFGFAGGLDPGLKRGDAVVGSWIAAAGMCWSSDERLSKHLLDRLW